VKDIDADRKVGVKTFPIIYGVKWTVVICLISLILFSAVVIMSENVLGIKSALLLSAASAAVFLLFASEERSDYYYSFWIDGMILLQAGMVLIVNQ
jgi:4-hydroxybenzoate polyprenyltransferase